MAKFKHGTMDVTVQTKVFDGFVSFVGRSIVVIILILVFMAIVGG